MKMLIVNVIEDYKVRHRIRYRKELLSFKKENIEGAIERAAFAVDPSGKRYSRQKRLSPFHLGKVYKEIDKIKLRKIRTFHSLFEYIKSAIGALKGIDELMVYDTALRLGAHLGFYPDRVYLHSGIREGAKAFHGDASRDFLFKCELPPELWELACYEIEGLLCVYKDLFEDTVIEGGNGGGFFLSSGICKPAFCGYPEFNGESI